MVLDIIKGIIGLGKGAIEAKKMKQEKRLELDLKKMEHRATLDTMNQKAMSDYDIEAIKAQKESWKDEYLTILMSLPIIGSFVPGVQENIATGWKYVALAPDWYVLSFLGIVAATFGLRWLFQRQLKRSR